jgi:hypothetical protein
LIYNFISKTAKAEISTFAVIGGVIAAIIVLIFFLLLMKRRGDEIVDFYVLLRLKL